MKRPAFQFYPGDWASNPNLRRCTFAEKGIWLDVMCLMHDQPEYGVLRWPLKEIAEAVKCRPADLQALERKGVLKGAEKHLDEPYIYVPRSGRKDGEPVTLLDTQPGPIWYSSRMVKDEYVRTIRGESTRFGEANGDDKGEASKPSPKPPLSDGSSSSSSSSPSGKEKAVPASPTPTPPKRKRRVGISLAEWIEGLKAKGEVAVPADDPVFRYAAKIGLPRDFLHLAWRQFREKYSKPAAKLYTDWRAVFRTAVEENWLKLWYLNGEDYQLTTAGIQAQRLHAEPHLEAA